MTTWPLEFYATWGSDNTARELRMKRRKERIKHTSLTTFSCVGKFEKNRCARYGHNNKQPPQSELL